MSGAGPQAPDVFLLQGSRGALYAAYFPPAPGVTSRGDVLYCPPFAEEMNRCRAMASLQARALSALGVGTLIVDPYGTGDSAGEFVEGTWEQWREDLAAGIQWLRQHGRGCVGLWGVRLGAVMAAELAVRDGAIPNLLLWQPVLNGKQFYTQFLRIRIAAELEQADGIKSTDELRKLSAAGQSVEVSGYEVAPSLANQLDQVAMPKATALAGVAVHWFEVLASAEAVVPRVNTKAVEDLQAAGGAVTSTTVVGPPFWQVHERELAPDLVAATAASVPAWRPHGANPAGGEPIETVSAADAREQPLVFTCEGDDLAGVLHRADGAATRGVVIIVAGGPQYRAGAHRQFVNLARKLARSGHPVLRFDLRGMGDSSGTYRGFQHSAADIRAAIDALVVQAPSVREVVLFGECESASGILFYAWRDPRVQGAVLVNPWVRTEEGQAQVIIKHYHLDRLRSPEFWKKVRSGQFDVKGSLTSLVEVLRAYLRGRRQMARAGAAAEEDDISGLPLPSKTAEGLRRFRGRVLLLMSGRDYIAREFDEVTAASKAWDGLLSDPRVVRRDLQEADHTFSRAPWKAKASDWVVEWVSGR